MSELGLGTISGLARVKANLIVIDSVTKMATKPIKEEKKSRPLRRRKAL
jgi:hypothetical protein